jgi:Uma2 family endonuclease
MFGHASVSIRYPVPPNPEAWVIPDGGTVPESTGHSATVQRLLQLLSAWAERLPGRVRIGHNLAIRWLEQHPRTGIDPDVCVVDAAPLDFDDDLWSLCLWKHGHQAPRLCIEVVSHSHPYKDYTGIQERYAALGTPELLVIDPWLHGPRSLGGPVPLQLWRRDATGVFERVHFGDEPVYSQAIDAWFLMAGKEIVIADDRAGTRRWLTELERRGAELERRGAELERRGAELERRGAELERERAEREKLEAELRELRSKQP